MITIDFYFFNGLCSVMNANTGTQKPDDVYIKLREFLDTLPIGYPKTDSGVEIKLLKRFFTPLEAEIALKLTIIPREAKEILRTMKKLNFTLDELEKHLDTMLKNGAINGAYRDGKGYFSIAFFAIGIFEYQLNRLDKGLMEDLEQYMDEGFSKEFIRTKIPQLRTIPSEAGLKTVSVEQDMNHQNYVSNYDEVKKLIQGASNTISVSDCICRKGKDILGKGCKHSKETCLQFGSAAHYYIDNKLGRQITKEEALKIVKKAQEEGLVIQPTNTERPFALCCCCGCSCEVLSHMRLLANPADYVASNFYAEVDKDLCTGCAVCETRCNMDAIKVGDDNISSVKVERCIGCGACISTCATDAIHLVKKKNINYIPAKDTIDLYQSIWKKKTELSK
jgi:electron transport complex protein RnfB